MKMSYPIEKKFGEIIATKYYGGSLTIYDKALKNEIVLDEFEKDELKKFLNEA